MTKNEPTIDETSNLSLEDLEEVTAGHLYRRPGPPIGRRRNNLGAGRVRYRR